MPASKRRRTKRHHLLTTIRYKDVECRKTKKCAWPECTCPLRTRKQAPEDIPKGVRVYRTPAGPHRKDTRIRVRPPGWSAMSDWVLVRTKGSSENWAKKNCEQQGMQTYLPQCQVAGKARLQAVFPGYLFVLPGDKWRSLRNTYGVLDIVMRGEGPDFVPRDVIRSLRKCEDSEGIFRFPNQRRPEIGESVRIQIGAWKGHLGVYNGQDPQERSRVLLKFMGQLIELKFRREASIEVENA